MSDYVKTTTFSSKTSANLVLGAELETEFRAIAVAIATKADETPTTFDFNGSQPFVIEGGFGSPFYDLGSIADTETATPNFHESSINYLEVTGRVGTAEVFTIANPTGSTPGSGPFMLIIASDNLVSEDTWTFGNKWYKDESGIGGLGPNDIAFLDVVYAPSVSTGKYLATQTLPASWVAA